MLCGSYRAKRISMALAGLLSFVLTVPAVGASVDYRVRVDAPLGGSANDYHIKVSITEPALVGDPINLVNGPFAGDGVTTHTGASFSVDWAGAVVTGGGPYEFGFDFRTNQTFAITEAWWTINSAPVENTPLVLFEVTIIPEPAAASLVGGVLVVGVCRRRQHA